jgi:hypothetical protein
VHAERDADERQSVQFTGVNMAIRGGNMRAGIDNEARQ